MISKIETFCDSPKFKSAMNETLIKAFRYESGGRVRIPIY